jgi:septation ring formation regulator EzrA
MEVMRDLTKVLQSLEAELARLMEANNWKDLPKNIRYALKNRIEDVQWQLKRLKEKKIN